MAARPLTGRPGQRLVIQMTLVGLGTLSLALILAAQLVSNEVVGFTLSLVGSAIVAVLIGVFWWLLPVASRRQF